MTGDSPQPPDNPPPAADPQSIEGLFLQALGQSAEQRQAFLDEVCGEDADRRRRIEALLRAYEDAGSFLEKPPAGVDTSATVSLEFLTPSDDPGLLGMLGPYEVYEMLGRGGMGIVFRARDPKLDRVVAIKVLAPELAANPNARRRFAREAKTAAAINHPHIVTIHAVDEGSTASTIPDASSIRDGSALPYIVMECIVGQTLQQKLDKQGSLRLMEILRIGHQTAQGLAAAHKQGLIHRDIKPANILLENGVERVKITDFGLARAADDVSITRTGEVSGSPQYMSPEQASGDTIDHRSDLFSLGCVLYAMCTGRSPFRATSIAAAIRRVCDDTPRPIEEINPEAPQWLIEIVNHLLAKDPDERIQSADEVAELLGEHLAGIQHPPRVRTQESARPRAVAAVPQTAAPEQAPRGLGMQVPLRILLWLGAIALLIPIFYALAGTAIGSGGTLEGAVIAAIICWPIALGLFAVALLDRSLQGNPFTNALFLLLCILLGPIGILMYLVRRDQYLMTDRPAEDVAPPQQVVSQQLQDKGESREVPQWLLTPLPGPVKVIACLLFAAACLVLGQAIEQWSDVSTEVGVCLYAAAIPLAVLALQCARGAGFPFRWPQVVMLGLLGIVLTFFGAQAPDREFKQTLATKPEMVALFTTGLYLVAIPIALLLWGLSQAGETGRARRDLLGTALISIGAVMWSGLATWLLLVAVGAVPPPPFSASSWITAPIMFAVMLGGLFFGAGMILRRYVVTPGMVRQFTAGKDVRSYEAGAVPAAATSAERMSPWRALAWMLIAGLVIVPGCLAVMLGVPMIQQARSGTGVVYIEFDNARPISWVSAQGDIGAAQADQRTIKQPVTSNPFSLPLPAGVYDLTMTWQADGLTGTFVQRVEIEARETKHLDVAPNVALALQPILDRRQQGDDIGELDDGFGPMRTIPLGGGGPGTIRFDTIGNVKIGRVVIDGEDVQMMRTQDGQLNVPADAGHHNLMLITQSGERYHFGVDVDDERGAVIQVPPGGEGILQVDFADPSLKIQLRRRHQVEAQPEEMDMGFGMSAPDPYATFTPLDPQQLGGGGSAFGSIGFGGRMPGFGSARGPANSVSTPGRYRVASGEYDVWITDHLAGWCRAGSQQSVSHSYETVTIAPGKSQTLTVRRSLKPMVKMHGGLSDFRLYDFRWNGNVETFTRPQAQVIERLFAAYADDKPDVAATDLLASIDADPFSKEDEVDRTSAESLKVIFDDGNHPAWGTMIFPGEAAESYRLVELRTEESKESPETPQPEMAVLQFDFTDPGLHVYLHGGTSEHSRRIGPIDDPLEDPGRVAVEAGTYTVMVEDDVAGWRTKTKYGEPDAVRYEFDEITLTPGQTLDLTIDRNFYKMAAGFLAKGRVFTESRQFLWQGQTYDLDRNQAFAVMRLLKALADGSTEVHEGRLLSPANVTSRGISDNPMTDEEAERFRTQYAEGGHTLKGWFDDGQHPAWGTLVVAGGKPNTYRLAELDLPELASSSGRALVNVRYRDARLKASLERFVGGDEETEFVGQLDQDDHEFYTEAGRYRVVVEDELAGWQPKTSYGEDGPVKYEYAILDLRADQATDLVIARNDFKMAAAHPDFLGADGPHAFRWQGKTHHLTRNQAIAVQHLLLACARKTYDVDEATCLWIEFSGDTFVEPQMNAQQKQEYMQLMASNGRSLKGDFDDGEHPAWGTLVIEGEKPGTYRLAELKQDVQPAGETSSATEAAGPASAPQAFGGSITPGPGERAGHVLIDIRDDGLLVGVRRRSAFDDSIVGGEQQITEVGQTQLRVHPGKYEVLIRDTLFGWDDRIKRLTVRAGENRTLTIERDFAEYAKGQSKSVSFRWDGQEYRQRHVAWPHALAEGMAVKQLLAAYAAGEPDVPAEELLNAWKDAEPDLYERFRGDDAPETLADLFQTEDAERMASHAWGRLIIPGEAEGTYRLAPIPEGTLVVTGEAPRLFAVVTPAEKNPRFTQRRVAAGMELEVPPGTYNVQVQDWGVGWVHVPEDLNQRLFGDVVVESPSVTIADGEKSTLTLTRDWNDYVEPIPYGNGTTDYYQFKWFPDQQTFIRTGGSGGISLNTRQARIVSRLLKGLAEDHPEVSESELIEALGDLAKPDDTGNTFESLADVFEGLVDGKWKELIVPGEAEGTWRLKPPAVEDQPSDAGVSANAAEPGDGTAHVPSGALQITVADEGLVVGVRRQDKSVFGGFQPAEEQQLSETGGLDLTAGDYQVRVHDELFGWGTWSDRDRQVTVEPGQTQELTIARDFAELVCEEEIHGLTLHWNGKSYKHFEPQQVALVNRLLKALATDAPAIAEDSLVESYNQAIREQYEDTNIASQLTDKTTLAEVFQGIGLSYGNDSEPIGKIADWQKFLVHGESEGTWRLKAPAPTVD